MKPPKKPTHRRESYDIIKDENGRPELILSEKLQAIKDLYDDTNGESDEAPSEVDVNYLTFNEMFEILMFLIPARLRNEHTQLQFYAYDKDYLNLQIVADVPLTEQEANLEHQKLLNDYNQAILEKESAKRKKAEKSLERKKKELEKLKLELEGK